MQRYSKLRPVKKNKGRPQAHQGPGTEGQHTDDGKEDLPELAALHLVAEREEHEATHEVSHGVLAGSVAPSHRIKSGGDGNDDEKHSTEDDDQLCTTKFSMNYLLVNLIRTLSITSGSRYILHREEQGSPDWRSLPLSSFFDFTAALLPKA
jgi:hypothetical protein